MTDSKIILITPPDKLFNQNSSCLLICPSDSTRDQAHSILTNTSSTQNVYIYNLDDENKDIDWLLSVAKMADVVILDLDNSPNHIRALSSYIVSLSHTYWLTSDDKWSYNKLSPNKIYSLDEIDHLIGGTIETAKEQ